MLYEAHMVLMTLAEGRSYVGFDVSSCHCGEGHPLSICLCGACDTLCFIRCIVFTCLYCVEVMWIYVHSTHVDIRRQPVIVAESLFLPWEFQGPNSY